jgi:gamma-glutamyltranspeptidase/glutathione hydrolase
MSWVAESPLTGPGAGGFMLVHRARDRSTRLVDFFVSTPGLGVAGRRRAQMESVDVDFSGESTQAFRIGSASCAVPGSTAGLAAVHRRLGTLPWRTLFEPAIEAARTGIELTRPQAHMHAILDLILRHTDEGRRVYGLPGRASARDVLACLTWQDDGRLAEDTATCTGELAREIVSHLRETGGAVTADDLRLRVIWHRQCARHSKRVFEVNAAVFGRDPDRHGLTLLDRLPGGRPARRRRSRRSSGHARQRRARHGRLSRLHHGGLAKHLFADETLGRAARIRAHRPGVPEPAPPGGTTRISVVDVDGKLSLSASTGSGSGYRPKYSIHMNNMLGSTTWARQPRARCRRMTA